MNIINEFASTNSDSIPLVISIIPSEGPLYIDTKVGIEANRLGAMNSRLSETLGPDLAYVSGKVVEKITVREGRVT